MSTGKSQAGQPFFAAPGSPGPFFQPKLSINLPNDQFEQEADRMANQVAGGASDGAAAPMQHGITAIQTKCAACDEAENDQFAQRKKTTAANTTADAGTHVVNSYLGGLDGAGTALPAVSRQFFESRFQRDFSSVKVHDNTAAAQSAHAIQAHAYTHQNHIVFGSGQYNPSSAEGKKLLAHELTHVVQQQGTAMPVVQKQEAPALAATTPSPTQILNTVTYTDTAYTQAVQAWPDANSIWDVLTTSTAKINFLRYILAFDQTNCVPYSAGDTNAGESCSATAAAVSRFTNACQGYASQMYARYTATGRLSATAETNLQTQANITIGTVPVKFQIPIRIATVPGHALNAVQVDADPNNINSWVFFEPQNDRMMLPGDPLLRGSIYASQGMFTLGRLTDFTASGQYVQATDETFLLNSTTSQFASVPVTASQRMVLTNLLRDIFIADDSAAYPYYTTAHTPPQTYEELMAGHRGDDVQALALAFTSVSGRTFRRSPGGTGEVITKALYLQLLSNPPGLDALIP